MGALNEVVAKYIKVNGIKISYFAAYIGCDLTKCSRWIKGERRLNSEQIRKTHEFLQGKFLKSIEDIMKGE